MMTGGTSILRNDHMTMINSIPDAPCVLVDGVDKPTNKTGEKHPVDNIYLDLLRTKMVESCVSFCGEVQDSTWKMGFDIDEP